MQGSYSLPFLSVFQAVPTHHRDLSGEIADHDRRRKELKKRRSGGRRRLSSVNQEMGMHENTERLQENNKNGELDEDLTALLLDLSKSYFLCSAKAT